jgi:hypothetical protein
MRTRTMTLAAVLVLIVAAASAPSVTRVAASPAAGPAFQSIGALAFGPNGVLFAADRQAATIFALELGAQPGPAGTKSVQAVDQKIAAALGTDAAQLQIMDLAVHPTTRHSYLSVMRGQGPSAQPALLRIDGAGAVSVVALDAVKFTSATLPNPPAAATSGRNNRMSSITDMAFTDGRLYLAGLSNEEFASKFWSVAYPFQPVDNGTSVEIYHGNHGAFETRSPVMAFVPARIDGQPTLIAGYTCTPLVKFPVSDLKPGAKVMGTTIAELGAGNQPIDMVLYTKDGREYLLMTNTRHGVMKIATAPFASAAGITARVGGTAGVPFEKIASMANVLQLDRLDATHSIVLARAAAAGTLDLEVVILP